MQCLGQYRKYFHTCLEAKKVLSHLAGGKESDFPTFRQLIKAPLKRGHDISTRASIPMSLLLNPSLSSTELRICPVCMKIDCSALIGLGSCIEMSVFSSWKLVSDSCIIVSVLLLLKCKNNECETKFTHF